MARRLAGSLAILWAATSSAPNARLRRTFFARPKMKWMPLASHHLIRESRAKPEPARRMMRASAGERSKNMADCDPDQKGTPKHHKAKGHRNYDNFCACDSTPWWFRHFHGFINVVNAIEVEAISTIGLHLVFTPRDHRGDLRSIGWWRGPVVWFTPSNYSFVRLIECSATAHFTGALKTRTLKLR
jgi:hypothetical protein